MRVIGGPMSSSLSSSSSSLCIIGDKISGWGPASVDSCEVWDTLTTNKWANGSVPMMGYEAT
eukprot:CAMPEP_0206431914 /NCGR_PEP_ID=MMETSP0324_2-20121206/7624_1 /ASSEMBLY_ACC=CAM_ASM_000836 /TAXON_ID=2866 /ORGANISM="Crypthecodinium cohnii, Strain Seligo" /LENGTH=61 /DNA_ID=CAMNT_0053897885 /DNA_START=695 /DNA_END=880 /DNA_ORIENTATION=-